MRNWFLIAGVALSLMPAFANNGKIAFTSNRDGNNEVYVMNADGTSPVNLTNTPTVDESWPGWRPDGNKLVYVRTNDVWTMNSDGSSQTRIPVGSSPLTPDYDPTGQKIAYSAYSSDADVFVMPEDGSVKTNIVSNSLGDYYPRWNSDGSKIAFHSFNYVNGGYQPDIYVVNPDGSGQTRLTFTGGNANPDWSPDSSKIVFQVGQNSNYDIYVMNADGSNPVRLTNNDTNDSLPTFSPDGSQIAFVSKRDGNNEIYVMNADGSNQTRLTNNSANDDQPSWALPVAAGSPTLNISDATVTEGNSGSVNLVFTVSLTAASTQIVTVQYQTADGTATAPYDYTAVAPTTLTFAPGETTKTINVSVQGDTIDEANERLNVTLFGASNAFIGDGAAIGTIGDNDSQPTLSIADVSQYEGNSGSSNFVFALSLSSPSGRSVTVSYATADGTATQPSDYTARTGTVTFAPGQTSVTVSVPVIGDTVKEADETFVVNLSTPVNATLADNQATATIRNDELPVISVTGSSVTEGDSGQVNAVFTVTLSRASTADVSFDFATAPGTATADVDYASTSGSRTILAGNTTKTISVPVNGDLVNEPNETFFLVLSNPVNAFLASSLPTDTSTGHSYQLVAASLSWRDARAAAAAHTYAGITGHLATVTSAAEQSFIATVAQSNETWLGALQPAGSVEPGGGFTWITGEPFIYTNWRSGEPNNANPTGIEDTLYYTSNGGTWNDISADVVDPAVQHYLVEYDGAPGAGTTQATATILNDDTPPALSINDVQVVEGDGTSEAVFTISVSGVSKAAMSVDVTTQDGTATAGADYQSVTSTLQIAQGQTSASVSVPIRADSIDEADETFKVKLSHPVNATISDSQGIGTITDDDAPPTLSINDVVVSEGTGGTTNADFTITLSGASGKSIAVDVITQNGTAVSGADYQSVNRTVQIPAGQSSVTVSVPITTDSLDEADETFTVNLSDPVNATLSDGRGIGTITNDDSNTTAPTVGFTTAVSTPTGTTPPIGGTIYNVVPTITGVAADAGTGIARVQLRLYRATATAGVYEYWNGTGWVIPGGTVAIPMLITALSGPVGSNHVTWSRRTGWPAGSNLADGTYYLNAYAFDRVGKFASISRNFKKLTDSTGPSVSFTTSATTPVGTTPVNGSTVSNTMPTITGIAADSGSGVARVEVRLYRPTATPGAYEYWMGSAWTPAVTGLSTTLNPAAGGASVSWSKSSGWPSGSTDFADGTYYLRAVAHDKAGNSAVTLASNFKKVTSAAQAPLTVSGVGTKDDATPLVFQDEPSQ